VLVGIPASLVARLREAACVVVALPGVEWGRRVDGPGPLVARLRERGRTMRERSPLERERLRKVISAIDGRVPGGPNCYRRALLEMSLDGGAARESLHFGLRVPGGPRSGHAWLGPSSTPVGSYDVQLDM
jgi:hypothetical protein